MIKCECQGCTKRQPLCHDTCASYQAYKAEKEKIRQAKMKDSEFYGYIKRCNDRAIKHYYAHKV